MTKLKRLLAGVAVITTGACGSSATTPTAITFHAEVADTIGDAVVSAGVPNPPDLVHGTADVSGASVTFSIQFAPGTFDRQSTVALIQLDTDQNPSTGIVAATGVGIDYILSLSAASNQVRIQQALPASCATGGVCYADVGVAALSVGTDSMTTTVPLATFGNASGRLNYRVFAYFLPQPTATVVADTMPDITLPPANVP